MDRSWLIGEPCYLPCWYGLKVGATTREESLSMIEHLTFIDKEEMGEYKQSFPFNAEKEYDPLWGFISTHVGFNSVNPGSAALNLVFVDDVLLSIR